MATCRNQRRAPGVVLGLGVMAVGALLTLDRMGVLDARHLLRLWPLVLVGVGATRLAGGRPTDYFAAAVWGCLGAWLLLWNFDYLHVAPWDLMWPLVLVFLGVGLALGALRRAQGGGSSGDTVSVFAILSGSEHRSNSPRFRGGDATAVLGGCKVDLREAEIPDGEATLQCLAFWGGVEILIPTTWRLDPRVVPILGALEDHTVPPLSPDAPRLVVKGFAIMGAIEVQHAGRV